MKLLALLAAVLLTVSASTDKDQWVAFKKTHSKSYRSLLEERTRFGIFQNNLRTIEEHNAKYATGEKTYYLGITRFADLTQDEFEQMLALQATNKPDLNASVHVFPKSLTVPESIDWRKEGAVLEVKDQGTCGSCWAFSATGSLEGQNIILNKVRTPLSEQQLIDCSVAYGNNGCAGGLMTQAFSYIKSKGIESEDSYPYKGLRDPCTHSADKTVLRIKGFKEILPTEDELKNAVGSIGPISVAMNGNFLQFFGGGILNEPKCNNALNHGVLAVGYGSLSNGTKYWIVKNSWGNNWGENGYFRLAKDANNMCGIASLNSYPVLQ